MKRAIAEYIKNHIREYLPAEHQKGDIALQEIMKRNDQKYTGLVIRNDEEVSKSVTVPIIYLESYIEQVIAGRPMDEVLREIVQVRMKGYDELFFETLDLTDYEQVKPMLFIQLCDFEKNQEYLKDKPFTPCGDWAATYRILLTEDDNGTGSAVITNDMMKLWGITKEQLHQDVVAAEKERTSVCFYSMEDVISGIRFSSNPTNLFEYTEPLDAVAMPMYILTNQNKDNGASVLMRDGVLDKIGELVGKNFYVLPSSVHELLIVPDNGDIQAKELESMVKEINATQVDSEDFLSDRVHYYNRKEMCLKTI